MAGPDDRHPDKPVSLKKLVLAAGRERVRTVGWREGDRGPLSSQFIALRARPANDAQRDDDMDRLVEALSVCPLKI